MGGTACDTNGAVYGALADNAESDVTVHAEQAGYSNFTFEVEVEKAKLIISRGGTDITDKTNTVIVGEQIALTCKFVNMIGQDFNIAPITNFLWTVPGDRVKDYVTTSTTGKVYSLTSSDFTNSTMTFYWVNGSGGSPLEVECTAIAKGVTMTAKAKFNVIRPTADLISKMPGGIVEVTNSKLRFGVKTGPVGVRFWGTNTAPSELATNGPNGNWSFMQLGSTSMHFNLSNGSNIYYVTNGLDTSLDYGTEDTNTTPAFSITTADSPANSLETTTAKCWRDDSFVMYLMFQAGSAGSIKLPIRQTEWFWGGTCTNVNGTWAAGSLLRGTNGFGSVNVGSTALPEWNHNLYPQLYSTNASWP